ncbi:ATP-binding cassette domain-containing protein, partial [bacterium]|nr:ATP-binding cassette domain-containing protein [bacterium]
MTEKSRVFERQWFTPRIDRDDYLGVFKSLEYDLFPPPDRLLEYKQPTNIAILGHAGSGKSTILQSFFNIYRPHEKVIWISMGKYLDSSNPRVSQKTRDLESYIITHIYAYLHHSIKALRQRFILS